MWLSLPSVVAVFAFGAQAWWSATGQLRRTVCGLLHEEHKARPKGVNLMLLRTNAHILRLPFEL